MRRTLLLILALAPATAADFDHSAWDRVLKKQVNQSGEVDYAAIKKDPNDLDQYLARLAASSPDNRKELFPTRAHELAYWLNAYNALVTKGVAARYPTRSVRDLGAFFGFFRRKDYTLGGAKLSLMHLENEIIRKRYAEPRIHFAIVCASLSCPLLARDAFVGPRLESQLDAVTRTSLSQRRMVWINPAANQITLSALFKWYQQDFGNVLEFVRKHLPDAGRMKIDAMKNPKLRYFDYDWSINDPGSRSRAKSEYERELSSGAGPRPAL